MAALGPDAHVEHRAQPHRRRQAVLRGPRRRSGAVGQGGGRRGRGRPLTTWSRVAELLAERHAAPPLLDMLAVDGRTALLFPFTSTHPVATRGTLHERYDEARALLTGLHADAALADLLGPPTTTADCFAQVWLERFVADLDIIEGYVGKDRARLPRRRGRGARRPGRRSRRPVALPRSTATRGTRTSWSSPDRLWLLDWEDLSVGDPVVDDAILLHDALGTDPHHWPDDPAYAVARRALMLDAVVDVAADWVENTDTRWSAGARRRRTSRGWRPTGRRSERVSRFPPAPGVPNDQHGDHGSGARGHGGRGDRGVPGDRAGDGADPAGRGREGRGGVALAPRRSWPRRSTTRWCTSRPTSPRRRARPGRWPRRWSGSGGSTYS